MTSTELLLDRMLRHQIYLEGYKASHVDPWIDTLGKLITDFRYIFSRFDYENMREFTRRELRNLTAQLNIAQTTRFTTFFDNLLKELQRFSRIEHQVAIGIMQSVTAIPAGIPKPDSLWARTLNEPIAATGDVLTGLGATVIASTAQTVARQVRTGYANGLTKNALANDIVGTASRNFRNGLIPKFQRWGAASINTAIQHVSATAVDYLSSKLFDNYQWVSVLDERTSEICISRNGRIYSYATGPRPPAHPNCRSTIVPIADDPTDMPTFKEWFLDQAEDVKLAYQRKLALTLEEYHNKLEKMIGD